MIALVASLYFETRRLSTAARDIREFPISVAIHGSRKNIWLFFTFHEIFRMSILQVNERLIKKQA